MNEFDAESDRKEDGTSGKGISIILPTLNEEEAITRCIEDILCTLPEAEIIVSDSSDDRTPEIAKAMGAKVVRVDRGYGRAYIEGFKHATGDVVVLCDADGSYNLKEVKKLLEPLLKGEADLVLGSRFLGKMEKGAMPLMHRIGNKLLTFILNRLFSMRVSDSHTGYRAIKKDVMRELDLKSDGMEFASEMLIKARARKLRIAEVPVEYRKRVGKSKLRRFRDGWRHLKLMLLYNPKILIYPGILLSVFGLILMATLLIRGDVEKRSMHSFILGGLALLTGYSSFLFGLMISAYSTIHGLISSTLAEKFLNYHSLEKELAFGLVMILGGIALGLKIIYAWFSAGFGSIEQFSLAVISLILILAGIQTIYTAFFLSMLLLER